MNPPSAYAYTLQTCACICHWNILCGTQLTTVSTLHDNTLSKKQKRHVKKQNDGSESHRRGVGSYSQRRPGTQAVPKNIARWDLRLHLQSPQGYNRVLMSFGEFSWESDKSHLNHMKPRCTQYAVQYFRIREAQLWSHFQTKYCIPSQIQQVKMATFRNWEYLA